MAKHEYNNVLHQLQYYMFNSVTIQNKKKATITEDLKYRKWKINDQWDVDSDDDNCKKKHKKQKKDSIYYPREQDQLFWIFYIIMHGNVEYECNKNNRFAVEQGIKYQYVDNVKMNKRNEKTLLKQSKITNLVQLEENLTSYKINESTFLFLCFMEGLNVYFVTNNKYYKSILNEQNEVFVIERNKLNKYGVLTYQSYTDERLAVIETSHYQVVHFEKPILAIGNYKVDDLIQICSKLKIDIYGENNKRKTKQILYESIVQHLR